MCIEYILLKQLQKIAQKFSLSSHYTSYYQNHHFRLGHLNMLFVFRHIYGEYNLQAIYFL